MLVIIFQITWTTDYITCAVLTMPNPDCITHQVIFVHTNQTVTSTAYIGGIADVSSRVWSSSATCLFSRCGLLLTLRPPAPSSPPAACACTIRSRPQTWRKCCRTSRFSSRRCSCGFATTSSACRCCAAAARCRTWHFALFARKDKKAVSFTPNAI